MCMACNSTQILKRKYLKVLYSVYKQAKGEKKKHELVFECRGVGVRGEVRNIRGIIR